MAKHRIFCVGFDLPGDEFEYVPFDSDQSLLDADIVLFEVGYGEHSPTEEFQGEALFSQSVSTRVARNIDHWRSELATAVNAGKLVIVYLSSPLKYFRYTGEQQFSGTGRSQRRTNIVNPVSSYSAVPDLKSVHSKSGREVRTTDKAAHLAAYWTVLSEYCDYEANIEGAFTNVLLTTKTGNKIVGAEIRSKSGGVALFLPPIHYDHNEFLRYDKEKKETFWTSKAIKFGKQLLSLLVGLAESFRAGRTGTPPPDWAQEPMFVTDEEAHIAADVARVSERIAKLQRERTRLEERLMEAGAIRGLLFEQGRPLESAVREALQLIGFTAQAVTEGDSEFDVVFVGPEGRFLGEVEGKDNRPINIDKMSQLERNLQEDFSRDGVNEYAKGVLFGNAERLKRPSERGDAFTEKCKSAARRTRVALVQTVDLFPPARYLRSHSDLEYARACRKAIFETEGAVVLFPEPPLSTVAATATNTAAGQNTA